MEYQRNPEEILEMADKTTNAGVDERTNSSRGTDQDQFMPFGTKLVLITISLMLAVLCVALDNTVRCPAPLHIRPRIRLYSQWPTDYCGCHSSNHRSIP